MRRFHTGLRHAALLVVLAGLAHAAAAEDRRTPEASLVLREAYARMQQGDMAAATPLYERLLALDRATHAPGDPILAEDLHVLATLYRIGGEAERGLPLLEEAATIAAAAGDRPLHAAILVDLGEARIFLGSPAEAVEPLTQALEWTNQRPGEWKPEEAQRIVYLLAEAAEHLGMFEEAHATYERAQQFPGEPRIEILCGLARVTALREEVERGRSLLDACIEGLIAQGSPVGLVQRNVRVRDALPEGRAEGKLLALRNRPGPAEPALPDGADPEDGASIAFLYNAAVSRDLAGDAEAASELYARAIRLADQQHGPGSVEAAELRVGRAALWMDDGRLGRAALLFQQAIAAYAEHPEAAEGLAFARSQYAILLNAQGARDEAREQLARALDLYAQFAPDRPAEFVTEVDVIGMFSSQMGAEATAVSAARLAIALREAAFGPDSIEAIDGLTNLGRAYARLDDHESTRRVLADAVARYEGRADPEHPGFRDARRDLAWAELATAADPTAAGLLDRAASELTGETSESPGASAGATLADRLERLDRIEGELIASLATGEPVTWDSFQAENVKAISTAASMHLQGAPTREALAERAATSAVRRKGRLFDTRIEAHRETRALGSEGGELRSKLAALRDARAEGGVSGADPTALAALAREEQAIEAEIALRTAGAAAEPLALADVWAAIPPDAVLLELVAYRRMELTRSPLGALYEPRYGAYVLRREGLLGWADLGEAAPIDATVTALRTSMADPLRRSSVAELAAKLYTQVIAPVETHLEGASHWIVAPDGQLSLAPFHALRDHDGRSVLERVAVSCVATGRHLARPPLAGRDAGPPVIVAAPDFDARRGMKIASASAAPTRSADLRWAHFGALPETAREAEAIAVKLPDAEIFLAAEADETRVKAVVRPRILHIATHGYFLESEADGAGVAAIDDPLLRSGLVLAGANHLDGAARGAEDDGVLTALEASSLDLAATELVVLSACETGLGAVGAGDGVFGLQRAFSMAGARSQVLSLWRVDDTATRKLMVGFYERLAGGASRLEALRQSQLALLADPATAHPFFWGAFQLYGDWGPLTPAP